MSAPGLVLSGRYRLNQRIAVGGMGEVWAADDIRLARIIAVKILRPELTGDPEFVERFRTEARITASLNHPGIAAVYDYGEVTGGAYPGSTAYLVMELIAGESLSAVLSRTGRLPVGRTLDVLDQTGRALQEAHSRSLVHRDIKPGNLLITPGGQVKITDFGIAKVAHQAPVTRMGMVMGTAQYISPEQAAGKEAVPASDIYSLGIVAYECLTGTLPYPNENSVAMALAHVRDAPRPLPPEIPPLVADLVMQMLIKDPGARYPNGAALAQAVGRVRSGVAPGRRTGPPPAATKVVSTTGVTRTAVQQPVGGRPTNAAAAVGPAQQRTPTRTPASSNRPATRVQPVIAAPTPQYRPPAAGRPSYGPGTATAYRSPPPGVPVAMPPASGAGRSTPGQQAPGRSVVGRRTGLSVLIAVAVLLLAGVALLVIDQLVGGLAAAASTSSAQVQALPSLPEIGQT